MQHHQDRGQSWGWGSPRWSGCRRGRSWSASDPGRRGGWSGYSAESGGSAGLGRILEPELGRPSCLLELGRIWRPKSGCRNTCIILGSVFKVAFKFDCMQRSKQTCPKEILWFNQNSCIHSVLPEVQFYFWAKISLEKAFLGTATASDPLLAVLETSSLVRTGSMVVSSTFSTSSLMVSSFMSTFT